MEIEKPRKLGRYEIIRELGKGAMGIVYEGLDPVINRRVAIKTARSDVMQIGGRGQEMMARFLREAHAAGALNHPGIITIYDAAEEDGLAYIAMEYFENGNLQDYIKQHGPLGVEDTVQIGATICRALHAAHDAGVIHRDIKPANIMVRQDGTIKVADFGIAHVSDSTLTQDGALIGTPAYMSPEQFIGHKTDGRSDLFSVAIMLYEMLTGEKPFPGETFNAVMHKVIKTEPVPPAELNPAVNESLNRVMLKALRKNPGQRYQTGNVLAEALCESLKANPDPAILGVVSSPPSDTVITPPKISANTMELPDPDHVPTTLMGTPPPNIETTSSFLKPRPHQSSYPRIGLFFISVCVLLGAGLFYFYPQQPKPAKTENNTKPAEAINKTKPTLASIDATIWFAPNKDAYNMASDFQEYSQCAATGKATLTILDKETGSEIVTKQIIDTGIITLPKPWSSVTVTITADGYVPCGPFDLIASEPNERQKLVKVLLKEESNP